MTPKGGPAWSFASSVANGLCVAKAQAQPTPGNPTSSRLHQAGTHTSVELTELFSAARLTVHRAIERTNSRPRRILTIVTFGSTSSSWHFRPGAGYR